MNTVSRAIVPVVNFSNSFLKLLSIFPSHCRHQHYSSSRNFIHQSFVTRQNCKRDICTTTSTRLAQPKHWGQTKAHRKVKLNFQLDGMANPETERILEPLRKIVKEQVTNNRSSEVDFVIEEIFAVE